ncbi:hypothetical protein XH86_14830 [Bradyrhizobium guangdongense]|uniref:DUF805 domain-containing protein n=2 Tax=Bradyrhizobium guangdongense TaxID=1325090 RepID=A0A7S7V4W6_9BRAD|nr:hypothetical protein XH86_14830 [Bradyrhizobium guangdongense]
MRIVFEGRRHVTFCGGQGRWLLGVLSCRVTPEMAMGFWLFVVVSIGSIPLAYAMARERGRSSNAWFWIAVVVGPLAPLALLILGNAKRPASAG